MRDRDVTLARAREALIAGTRNLLETFRRDHSGETVYGIKFLLEVSSIYLGPTVATEEGLTRVARKYARLGYRAGEGDTLETLRTYLRWANPDDGWYFLRSDPKLAEAEGLLEAAFGEENGWEQFVLESLRELADTGGFDTGTPGKEIVVTLTYQDESDEDSAEWAEVANPPAVVERYRRELEAARRVGESLRSPYA